MPNYPEHPDSYINIRSLKQPEATMLQTQLEQRALLNAIPDMVFVMSADGTYLDFKLDKEHQLIEDLVGRNVCELGFMPLAVAQNILEKIKQSILTGQTQSLEYQIEGKVNQMRRMAYYEARFSVVDADKALMVVRDVSLQKKLENDLREVAEKNQRQATELELLEQVRTFIGSKVEPILLFRAVVEAVSQVLGYQFVGIALIQDQKLVVQHQVGYDMRIMPSVLELGQGVIGRVAKTGQAELIVNVAEDPDYIGPTDWGLSEICVPFRIQNNVVGVLNVESTHQVLQQAQLEILLQVAIYVGLLEQAQLYQELQNSEIRYRELIENASDIIYRTDIFGRFTYTNSVVKRLLGYSEEAVLGKHYLELVRPDYHEQIKAFYIRQVKDNSASSYFEFPAMSAEGKEFWLGQNVQLIWQDNTLRGMQAVARDITQRKYMEEALHKQAEELSSANADLQQFAFVAAHDLQEPLRKIQAFGDRLSRKYKDVLDEQGQDYLSRMHASASRMRHLIDDLLLFAKTTKHERSLVSLEQVAKEIVSDLQSRIEETQGHIEIGSLPTLWANPIQMRQVLQNLLGNALKFHKPVLPPAVKLMSKRMGSQWDIYVQDNGIGFDEQYKDRIFKVFQRLHSSEKYEGTGMGLAIVRKIVESYDGSIDVYSRPGQGSTFIISFPIVSATKNPVLRYFPPSTKNTDLEVLV